MLLISTDSKTGEPLEIRRLCSKLTYTMILIDFIQAFNNSLPTTNDLKKKFGDDFDAVSFANELKLNCNPEDEKTDISSMSVLLSKTNIAEISIVGFSFYSEPRIKSNGLTDFGMFNDFYYFASNTEGQIISFSLSFEDFEVVSASVELFLKVLLTYTKYNTQVVYHNNYDLTQFDSEMNYYITNGMSKQWLKDFFPSM